jgi:hypothetical protein
MVARSLGLAQRNPLFTSDKEAGYAFGALGLICSTGSI